MSRLGRTIIPAKPMTLSERFSALATQGSLFVLGGLLKVLFSLCPFLCSIKIGNYIIKIVNFIVLIYSWIKCHTLGWSNPHGRVYSLLFNEMCLCRDYFTVSVSSEIGVQNLCN